MLRGRVIVRGLPSEEEEAVAVSAAMGVTVTVLAGGSITMLVVGRAEAVDSGVEAVEACVRAASRYQIGLAYCQETHCRLKRCSRGCFPT